MAGNYNPVCPTYTAAGSSSRLDAYSYYYQNFYGVQQNNCQDAAAYVTPSNGQPQPANVYNYFGTPCQPYSTGQEFQSVNTAISTSAVRTPKTVAGRPRSPVERVLRYRLDDNEVSSSMNETKYSRMFSSTARANKRPYPDNRENAPSRKGISSINPFNEAVLFANAKEKKSIELQLNEAMFYDRLFEVNFATSWYKLKKKNEDGSELVCVVVEIVDCDKKVYKVYGGYTSDMRSKELAFGQAIKKLNAIIEEQDKERLEKAKQLITHAVVSNTPISSLPLPNFGSLVPNPLYQSSASTAAAAYGQQYSQILPPGTENVTCEYDPVNYAYDYHNRQQPLPPGTEKNFYEVKDGSQKQKQSSAEPQSSLEKQQSVNSAEKVVSIDRPCSGRGEQEDKFTKKAREMGFIFRCIRKPSKMHFNAEFFVFEVQFGKPNDPQSKTTVTGSSLRDEGIARESVYAMAFDELKKLDKKPSKNIHVDYECDWISPVPPSMALPKTSYSSAPKAYGSSEASSYDGPMRKIVEAPNWDWASTSNDLSAIKFTPIFSMGRGKPKNFDNIATGGGILDHRDWRWPAC